MRKPRKPDRMAMEIAHRKLRIVNPLNEVLKNPLLKAVITAVARKHMYRRELFDAKKLQANDID